jgi:crotonobetaine/carnitine-CoA ligase
MEKTQTLASLVHDRSRWPEEPPLLTFVGIDEAGEYEVDYRHYASLWRRGQAIARLLRARGLRAGDRFALLMQNHADFVDAMVASAILGTVFVAIDPRTRGKKLEYMLATAECKGVLVGDYCMDALTEALPATPSVAWAFVIGTPDPQRRLPHQAEWLESVVDEDGPELPIALDDLDAPMQMQFTSGTTGDPKAIVGSYRRYAIADDMMRLFRIEPTDRMYTGLSLTHANPLLITVGGALYGAIPAVVSRRFTKTRLWDVIRDFDCTTMNMVGGMFSAIYSEPPDPRDADNPLRKVLGGGMPRELWEPFTRRFSVQLVEFYGTAEGGMMFNHPGEGPIGSIGRPPENLIAHILDENDAECAPGVAGEIVFESADRSPLRVSYHGNPQASEKKARGGLLRTGDIGYRDEEGWFYYLHRQGNEIRRNGEFVSPGYIEKELAEHPDVDDVFVYGVAAASGTPGEKDVVAAIVATDRGHWNPASVFALCQARLEANSVPSYLQLVDEIPKTASEKPMERVLLESFAPTASNVFTAPERA